MQFRRHGRRVQVIRSAYLPEIKRSRQQVIGSFPADCEFLSEVPFDILRQLSESEEEELEQWIIRQRGVELSQGPFSFLKGYDIVQGLAAFVAIASEVMNAEAHIRPAAVRALNKALQKFLQVMADRGYALQCIQLLEPIKDPLALQKVLRQLTFLSRTDRSKLEAREVEALDNAMRAAQVKLQQLLQS